MSLMGTYCLQKSFDGIFFSSYLHIIHNRAVFISSGPICYSGIQGNTILQLFHKHHLLAESELA